MKPNSRSSRWALASALAILAILILMLRFRPEPPPREVLRQDLVRRGDRMCLSKETNPFSGLMIERYPSGALQSRSALRDGLLHGVSEGWFTNGVLQVREFFTNGVSHGPRVKFYPDGQKLSEATIVAGMIEGTFRRWHAGGVLAEEITMRANKPHGESRSYHPDGSLKARAVVADGRVLERNYFPAETSGSHAPAQVH